MTTKLLPIPAVSSEELEEEAQDHRCSATNDYRTLSITLAARLSGMSVAAFKRNYLATRLIVLSQNYYCRPCIWKSELEEVLGRKISTNECNEAYARGSRRREYQREYRENRRKEAYEQCQICAMGEVPSLD